MDPLTRLNAGVDQMRPVIAGVDPSQMSLPTPCSDWNVEQLTNHILGTLTMFRDVAINGEADPSLFSQDLIGEDAATSFNTVSAEALAAWAQDGKMEGSAKLPFGEFPAMFALQLPAMELMVHGWDLSQATGEDVTWNPALVADTLEFCTTTFTSPEMRGTDFAEPIEVSADSDDLSKLLAFMGRRP